MVCDNLILFGDLFLRLLDPDCPSCDFFDKACNTLCRIGREVGAVREIGQGLCQLRCLLGTVVPDRRSFRRSLSLISQFELGIGSFELG